MEFITSKGSDLPTSILEMERSDYWFNMWSKRFFPYKELERGDILYWYNTIVGKLVWKTEIVQVKKFPYSDKRKIFEKYGNKMSKKYYEKRSESGYFLQYDVRVLEKLDIPKPKNYHFNQLAWERVSNRNFKWLEQTIIEESGTLDDYISDTITPIGELLIDLNEKMKSLSPEKVEKLISTTIRKDTPIINALKEMANFKCQFPNCGKRIEKVGGCFYIEVAHIKPVAQKGQSILGNLLVLCPNHHKEFDYGELKITEQTNHKLKGILNRENFEIYLIYPD